MLSNINSIIKKIFKPLTKKIWARTGNWVDYRRDVAVFQLYLISSISIFFIAILYFSQGYYTNTIMNVFHIIVLVFCMTLVYKGHSLWAKDIGLGFIIITFFITSSLHGRGLSVYIYYIPIITATLFFYNTSQIRHTVFLLILCFLSIVVLESTDYALLGTQKEIDELFAKIFTIVALFISLSLGGIMVKELIVMNRYNQSRLRRLNQKLQKRNHRLKKINTELDSFVYRSSHDLRSPLTSIMGIINIIKSENDITKVQEYMMFQEKSVRKLDNLVQDILDISRNSRLDIESGSIDLKSFLKECVEAHGYMDEYEKVKVIIDVPDSFVCYSDSKRLKVVFNNIISNGLRYYDFSKSAPLLNISLVPTQQEGLVTIIFDDNGMGIKEEHLDKIFNMFYRGTDRNNGSGLGLYIVHESMDKIGGKVKVSSTYGKGTSVLVSFFNNKPNE